MSTDLLQKAVAPSLDLPWEQDIVALRRDLHEHPELGFEEIYTSGVVAERLRALGLEVRTGLGVTGVVGILRGGQSGPTVLVRADMDALPIEEANEWEWKSANPGKMHACGHDAHTSIGLTVARLLTEEKDELAGTVVFMFQPAEEGGGGAGKMIEDGLLDDPRPDFALALHVWTPLEAGKLAVRTGPTMASADRFVAKIIGRGGHGAHPETAVDPIVIASQIVVALQTTISRNLSAIEPGVVTVGRVWAGSAFNIIPNEAHLEGTVRAYSPTVRDMLENRCREIVEGLPPVFGARGEFVFERGYPATVNDPAVADIVRRAASDTIGAENVEEFEPTMGAEDMSMVLERVPGCYFFVGAGSDEANSRYGHHHPNFNIDERALSVGTRCMVAAVKECLAFIKTDT